MKKQSISIIGAGEIGSALRTILQNKKNISLLSWDKDETRVPEQRELAHVVATADFLFLCIPSWVLHDALRLCLSFLQPKTIVISVTKGIVSLPSLKSKTPIKFVPHLFEELLPKKQPFALLSGPMLAEELEQGLIAAGTLATKNSEVYKKIHALFKESNLILQHSSDVFGVALCGVLKNVYAMILGISDGLELGNNTKGYLIGAALGEMERIVSTLGGRRATAYTYAGLGDLIATGSSTFSKNYTVGRELALHGACATESEGKASLAVLVSLLKGISLKKDFPLLSMMYSVLSLKKDVRKACKQYFQSVT